MRQVQKTIPSHALTAYAGRYHSELYGDLVISERNGSLHAEFYPGYQGTLSHWHYDTFQILWSDATLGNDLITFRMNARGEVVGVAWDGFEEFSRQ